MTTRQRVKIPRRWHIVKRGKIRTGDLWHTSSGWEPLGYWWFGQTVAKAIKYMELNDAYIIRRNARRGR